jgi:hypothetical protein
MLRRAHSAVLMRRRTPSNARSSNGRYTGGPGGEGPEAGERATTGRLSPRLTGYGGDGRNSAPPSQLKLTTHSSAGSAGSAGGGSTAGVTSRVIHSQHSTSAVKPTAHSRGSSIGVLHLQASSPVLISHTSGGGTAPTPPGSNTGTANTRAAGVTAMHASQAAESSLGQGGSGSSGQAEKQGNQSVDGVRQGANQSNAQEPAGCPGDNSAAAMVQEQHGRGDV